MKKALLLILCAALISSMCACSAKTSNTQTEDTTVSTEEMIEDGAVYDEDIFTQTKTISEGGTDEGLWPSDEIPSVVPEFSAYTTMYPANYQKTSGEELWLLGFDTDSAGYDTYINSLQESGFRKSSKISGFWGNGEIILDISKEDNGDGTIFLSIDVYKTTPIETPEELKGKFPEFTTDSSLYYWSAETNELTVAYACGTNFDADLASFKEKLTAQGFTVEESAAKKEDGGKTYMVEYGPALSKYEDKIVYSCHG